jgi:hypothetical protein
VRNSKSWKVEGLLRGAGRRICMIGSEWNRKVEPWIGPLLLELLENRASR